MSEKIKVAAYSGYKANERPLSFFLSGEKINILEISGQWKDGDYDCFRVMGSDHNRYVLKWERNKDHWLVDRT